MENGGRFNSKQVCNDEGAPRSVVDEGSGSMMNNPVEGNEFENLEEYMRNPEEYMPIANIVRIMRRALPPQAKVADDAKETVQACLTEFIGFVTSEANARCNHECRKTITADDLLESISALGFIDHVHPLTRFLTKLRESDPDRRSARISYAPPPRTLAPPSYVEQHQVQLPRRLDGGGEGSSRLPAAGRSRNLNN